MSFRARILKLGSGTVVVTALSSVLMLVSTVVLARSMTPQAFSDFSFVIAMINICLVLAQFGLPHFVLRWTAKYDAEEDWHGIRSVWVWVICLLGVTVLATLTLFLAATGFLASSTRPELAAALWAGAVLLPLMALTNVLGFALRGLRRVVLGHFVVAIPRHVGIIVCCGLFLAFAGTEISAMTGVLFQGVGLAAGLVIAVTAIRLFAPKGVWDAQRLRMQWRPWIVATATLAVVAGFRILNKNMDIVGLGFLGDSHDAGVYRVAVQLSLIISIGLGVVNTVTAPWMSRLHTQGRLSELQTLVSLTVFAVMLIAVLAFAVLVFAGSEILTLLFGEAYSEAYVPLMILSVGQIANAAFGPVGLLLNMTGHETHLARSIGRATLANLILLVLLIPFFGTIGAAIATASTFLMWNIMLWRSANRILSLDTSVFGAYRVFRARLKR